jgi:hypothetical protein
MPEETHPSPLVAPRKFLILQGSRTAMRFAINIAAFYIGWFSCVLGAARGMTWLGPAVVFLLFLLHLGIAPGISREIRLAVVAAGAGFLVDTALIAAGVFTPVHRLLPMPLSPPWLVAMWVNFATTLNICLKRLHGHPVFCALLGAIGGPAAYYAGARLGAIQPYGRLEVFLAVLAVVWAIAVPVLFRISAAIPDPRDAGTGSGK